MAAPKLSFLSRLTYPAFWLVAWVFVALFGPLATAGRRRVPRRGGLLILCNHRSDCDPVVLQLACRRRIRYMAKAELFGMRLLGPLIRFMGTFPVQRDSADREALRIAVELARGGEVVGMFPEGQIGDDTKLGKLMEGAALIARMSGVPVICCGLRGTERIIPYGKILPRPAFRLVRATWWEPRLFGPHATTDEIMDWARAEMIALGGYEPD